MLKTAVHWMLIVGAIADFILLLRILGLKLHRLYAFITLDAALGLLFDATGWWLGWDSREYARVYFYSRFLYAAVVQAVAWDVFEEVSIRSAKVRRLAAVRLRAGLISTGLLAVFLLFVLNSDTTDGPEGLYFTGTLLWASSCVTSLLFLIKIYRTLRTEKFVIPHNTVVWARFYQFSFAFSLADSALLLSGLNLGSTASGALDVAFIAFELALVSWCVVRLQGVPQNGSAAVGSQGSQL
jgi:hypothetical protein